MDGSSLKRFASDAGTFFNRAKQYTEEKLGQAERTELDAHFENLLQRADKTKEWTEKVLANTRGVLQPNPNVRLEEYIYDKLDKKKRDAQNAPEFLGNSMIDAGNEFGPGTAYGSALVKCGQTQLKLGQAEKDLINSAANNFLQPLRAFLDGDMKTLTKERKTLESKRLDLDVAKNKLRRAKTQGPKEQGVPFEARPCRSLCSSVPLSPTTAFKVYAEGADGVPMDDESVAKAEADLRVAQAEFNRQAEITKLLLEGISSTHAHHLRCLHDFIEAQSTYYAQCQQYMADLQRQLGSYSSSSVVPPLGGGSTSPTVHASPGGWGTAPSSVGSNGTMNAGTDRQKARVLYDYDAADMKELSLIADEIITVYRMPGQEAEWMMGERDSQTGRVPTSYLQIMN